MTKSILEQSPSSDEQPDITWPCECAVRPWRNLKLGRLRKDPDLCVVLTLPTPTRRLLFVLMEIDDLPRLIHFYGHLSAGGNILEHAALGFEFKILLTA